MAAALGSCVIVLRFFSLLLGPNRIRMDRGGGPVSERYSLAALVLLRISEKIHRAKSVRSDLARHPKKKRRACVVNAGGFGVCPSTAARLMSRMKGAKGRLMRWIQSYGFRPRKTNRLRLERPAHHRGATPAREGLKLPRQMLGRSRFQWEWVSAICVVASCSEGVKQ